MAVSSTVLTGAFTLAGALGGVGITQRYTARQSELGRLEARRALIRAEMVRLVPACMGMLDASRVEILAFTELKGNDLLEFVNSDSGKLAIERNQAIRESITSLSLLVADPALLLALAELERAILDYAEKANGPAFEYARKGGDRGEAVLLGFKHVRATRDALTRAQVEAATLLRAPVAVSERSGRFAWLHRRRG